MHRRPLIALLAFVVPLSLGARCLSVGFLPVLVASDPAGGATVARTAWFVLDFEDDVPSDFAVHVYPSCDGAPAAGWGTYRLDADTLVVQPAQVLPAGASCRITLNTEPGEIDVDFQTAAAGAPFAPVYDRRDVNHPLPFPDDIFLEPDASRPTGWRPALALPDHPGSAVGLLQVLAQVTERDSDGWSPIGNLSIELSGAPDLDSLPLDADAAVDPFSTIALIDMTPASETFGERIPFQLTPRSDQVQDAPVSHNLLLFPSIPLEPMGTYGLVVTDRLLDPTGEPLRRSAFFEAVVGDPEPGEAPEIAAARPLAEEVLDAAAALSPLPIPRDDVLAMREDVQATAPNVIVTDVLPDPHPDVAAMIFGTFDAPVWVENGYVVRDDDGAPVPIGTAPVDFILALPAAAAESGGAPIVMYQHGNPGNAPDEVPGAARDFLAPAGFAVGGMTDVPNRTFAAVLEQTLAIFTYVLFFGEPPDWYLQTYAEQMAFLRALQSLDELDVLPLGDPDGVPDLDPSKILYEGISYGSVHAQAFLAYSPDILGAALVAGASRLAELIEYQDRTTPDGGPRLFVETLPAFLSDARAPDLWLGLHLFAITYDRQDPHNHARFLFRDPVEVDGTTKKASLLVVEGVNDSFTKANTTRSLAWLLGPIPQLEPVAVPVLGLPSQAGPIQANIDADTTAAFVQFVPSGVGLPPTQGCDFQPEGHFCAQTAPPARTQRLRFYTSALTGPPVIEFEPEL